MDTFLIMMGIFIVSIFIGVPIAFSIGVSVVGILLIQDVSLALIAQTAFSGLDTYTFLAIPMFISAGLLMEKGGISTRLIRLASNMVGGVTGGLGIITVVACMFFAAISGSSQATVAAIGAIMIPAMKKDGYDINYAGALTASAGSLGVLIPPSITMIIYAIAAEVSVGEMFTAGFVPGILAGGMLILTNYIISRHKGYKSTATEPLSTKELWVALWEAKWSLLSPVIILGGIYSGIFTPTESAVVAVLYAIIVGCFIHKEIKLKEVLPILAQSGIITATVVIILGFAIGFSRYLTIARIPQSIAEVLVAYGGGVYSVYFIFLLLTLVCGTFMVIEAMILIFTPIFLPILIEMGVSPIHFGIMFVLAGQMGFLTPPVGVNLFTAQAITKTSLLEISRHIWPFLLAMLITQVLLILFPEIVLFLPNLIYGK